MRKISWKFLRLVLVAAIPTILGTLSAYASLGPGVNLPSFTLENSVAVESKDFQLIASAGFRHVRQPIVPELFQRQLSNSTTQANQFEGLIERINLANSQGLVVVVDLHPSGLYKASLAKDPRARKDFVELWRKISKLLKGKVGSASFEILNEPGAIDNRLWWRLQYQAIRAIRTEDPSRAIVAAGASASTISDLMRNPPYPVKNILYSFHYYKPMVFTHQGASWGSGFYEDVRGVAWPILSRDFQRAMASVLNTAPKIGADLKKRNYDSETIKNDFQKVSDWAKSHKVEIYCGEFGVFKNGGVDRDSRILYLRDVRNALDIFGIDWAVWQYTGGFGILNQNSKERTFDAPVLDALGRSSGRLPGQRLHILDKRRKLKPE